MTVQELFRQAQKCRVEEAYFLQHTVFGPYEKYSLDEKVDAAMRIRKYIRGHMARLATCYISKEEPQTVFIAELPCECYEDKGKTELTLFSVLDDEAYQKVQKDFTLWSNDGECRIECYGIDMSKLECIAGYRIAKKSVEALGITACCVEIMHELFAFGYSDEIRIEDRKEKLFYCAVSDFLSSRSRKNHWGQMIEWTGKSIRQDALTDLCLPCYNGCNRRLLLAAQVFFMLKFFHRRCKNGQNSSCQRLCARLRFAHAASCA